MLGSRSGHASRALHVSLLQALVDRNIGRVGIAALIGAPRDGGLAYIERVQAQGLVNI